MTVDWNINWAPTIVTAAISVGVTLFQGWLRRKLRKSKPHSEEAAATYDEGSTRRFDSVKTWSRREYELKTTGGLRVSEETITFEDQKGKLTVDTTTEIQEHLEKA